MSTGEMPFFQRMANRLGAPFGVIPFPYSNDFATHSSDSRGGIFERIYQQNYWTTGESDSGPGSELETTRMYRPELISLLRSMKFTSMFDAPCGDLNWMSWVLEAVPLSYVGGDISPTALDLAARRVPNADLQLFDICQDPFPECEVWHCRDALFHLSFSDIRQALENAARAKIKYALLTTHRSRWLRNLDITTGSWRYLDLERPPFNFPRAQAYLRDYRFGEFPRFVGLWQIEQLRHAVARWR